MGCTNCFTGCDGLITSDSCVKYTGADIPLLGICKGDQLSVVEKIIIDKFLTVLDGTGIDLSEIDIDCTYITGILDNKDKTLFNLVQVLFQVGCNLKEMIDQINQKLDVPFSLDTSCLTLPANPTRDDILKAAVAKICNLSTRLTVIESDYVKASQLTTLIKQYLDSQTNSNPTTIEYFRNFPKDVAFPYFGSLSNFDSTGKGLDSAGLKNFYLCNGQNGTEDLRGFTIVGAIKNVPGATLDPIVDPSIPANAGTNYGLNDKWGKSFVGLTVSEMPSHNHNVTDPTHDHGLPAGIQFDGHISGGEGGTDEKGTPPSPYRTGKSATGITISATGGNQAHENRQPSKAVYFVVVKY